MRRLRRLFLDLAAGAAALSASSRLALVPVAIAAAAISAAISVPVTRTSAQGPTASGAAIKTPWGEPDLQGIWTDEFDTPLQRPAKYANQEYFTKAQREELDKQRGTLYGLPKLNWDRTSSIQLSMLRIGQRYPRC